MGNNMVKGVEIYVVQPGDTVDSIAELYTVDVWTIVNNNQILYPYELAIGQALFIDLGTREPERGIRSTGYAYPFIDKWILEQTLPYLSELPVFSYGFTPEGYLIPPELEDQWMVETADSFGTKPVLTLTPFGTDGKFNNMLISAVVNSPKATKNMIDELVFTMRRKGYDGVNIDFEYILASDKDAFTNFVKKIADSMRANGYHTSVALAPKTSANQPGLLYEGTDYKALG